MTKSFKRGQTASEPGLGTMWVGGAGASRSKYAVAVGFPCGSLIPAQTAFSLAKTMHALSALQIPVQIHSVVGSSSVTTARSVVLTNYLEKPEPFLFWVDSDIVWTPEQFIRVLRLTAERGIVLGAYPLKEDPPRMPYNPVEGAEMDDLGLVEVTGGGLGFCCMKREIVQQFAETCPTMIHATKDVRLVDGFRFDTVQRDGERHSRGEDIAFLADLRGLGHKVWLDATVQLGHVGHKEYRMPMIDLSDGENNV